MLEYPGTTYREDAMYYRLESAYTLAINSVIVKKEDRLNIAQNYYNAFNRAFPESKYKEEADKMGETLKTELETIKVKS